MKTGSVPAILEDGENRSIYSISNDHGDFEIYAKYRSNPANNNKGNRWDFIILENEAEEIKKMDPKEGVKYLFCFICGKESLAGSEIAFLDYDELRRVIGEGYASPTRRVSIVAGNGKWTYEIYGTALNIGDQALKITRNVNKRLVELGFMKEQLKV